jgi:acetone carboxylase gamma subunit
VSRRCQALDLNNGARCRRNAVTTQDIHGESEFRDTQWSWVRVYLCAKHSLSTLKEPDRDLP